MIVYEITCIAEKRNPAGKVTTTTLPTNIVAPSIGLDTLNLDPIYLQRVFRGLNEKSEGYKIVSAVIVSELPKPGINFKNKSK